MFLTIFILYLVVYLDLDSVSIIDLEYHDGTKVVTLNNQRSVVKVEITPNHKYTSGFDEMDWVDRYT